MESEVRNWDSINPNMWEAFLASQSNASFFHTIEYVRSLLTAKRFHPVVLAVTKNSAITSLIVGYKQSVRGGVLSWISSRVVIMQAPLYTDEESLIYLLESYKKVYGHLVVQTEIRLMTEDETFHRIAQMSGFLFRPHLNSIISCNGHVDVWKSISESKRRQIKKAIQAGVSITENPTEQQVSAFYDILCNLYKTKIKKPLIDKEYFLELRKMKDGPYHVRFLLVIYNDSVIGGIVAPISRNRVIHEHYVAGLDADFKNQYPSIVATWAAIDYAKRNGIQYFDFMGAGRPDEDYGVRDFKLKFGGVLVNPGRFEYIPSMFWHNIATRGFALYQRLRFSGGNE